MRRSEEYAINKTVYTARRIASECHCSVTTVYDFWSKSRGTDQEKFEQLKKNMISKTFKVGFTSLQTISQKTKFDRSLIYNFIRSAKGQKYHTELLKAGEHLQPQVMVQTVDLNDFIEDLRDYKRESDRLFQLKAENRIKREAAKHGKKTEELEELKKAHPLVTDERFFTTSFFPNIDTYFILTECNYHRPMEK